MRVIRRSAYWVPPREISMRIRRVLPNTVSEPANPVWETALKIAIAENSVIPGDRAAIFRPTGRKNPDWNSDPWHAAQRQQFQLALHVHNVTLCMAAASFRITIIILSIADLPLAIKGSLVNALEYLQITLILRQYKCGIGTIYASQKII